VLGLRPRVAGRHPLSGHPEPGLGPAGRRGGRYRRALRRAHDRPPRGDLMPANWRYVIAAYGIAAVALLGYWRHLARRRIRALTARPRAAAPHRRPS